MHQSFRDGFEKSAGLRSNPIAWATKAKPTPAMTTWNDGREVAKDLGKVRAARAETNAATPYAKAKPADTTWSTAAKTGVMPKFNPKPPPQPQA
jgi:hypothetical protein